MKFFAKTKLNFKKIVSSFLIITFLFGGAGNLYAISLADIEFLISIGVIAPDQADFARQAAEAVNQQGIGSALKTDPNSELECLVFNQNLVKGNSGTVISAMQRFLQRLGHFPKDQSVTGYYGDMTVQAVADFQLAYGLITSRNQIGAGAVGPITRTKIQQISCNQQSVGVTAPAQNSTATTTNQSISTSTSSASIVSNTSKNKPYVKPKLTLRSFSTYANEESGVYHFRYDMSILPDDDISYFKLRLVCAYGLVTTNRDDLVNCGDTLILRAPKSGKKSIKIGFTNTSKVFQTIGLGVEAFDENDRLLDFAETINELSVTKPVTYISQTNKEGVEVKYGIPEPRNCDPGEQLQFIKYTMTVTQDPQNPIIPPNCWPGDIMCNTAISYPPTYCRITNGPSSDDLCPLSERFFNGKCIKRS